MQDIKPLIADILPMVKTFRQTLHAHPERGYQENETARLIIEKLADIPGMDIREKMAQTGIVATLGAQKSGPCVALRADMDALSIQEDSDLPYKSQVPGVMHACGHDGHTACLLGAVLVLSKCQSELEGPVKFIFQPAEEGGAGGERMCSEGALKDPAADAIYGLHGDPGPGLQVGDIAVRKGPTMAACGSFAIEIRGKAGHASRPHGCVDPIYVGMLTGVTLQSVVSRLTNPMENAVLTITKFHGGETRNAIPEKAVLEGSVRALSAGIFRQTLVHIQSQAEAIAAAYGARAEVILKEKYPAVFNHSRTTEIFRQVVEATGKAASFKYDYPAKLGGEDFAYYAQKIPGTYWFLGLRPPREDDYPDCHNPRFDFNDDALATGIEMHCEIGRRFAALWQKRPQPA